jgi:hypothetical protein
MTIDLWTSSPQQLFNKGCMLHLLETSEATL